MWRRCRWSATAAVAKPVLTSAQRRSRTVRRTLAARGFNECVSFSFIARDQARLFGGGDDARQLVQSHRLGPGCAAALAAAVAAGGGGAQCGAGLSRSAICSRSAPAFQSGMPEAQTTNAAGIITGAGVRDWTKSGHAADLFDAKAAMIAALEAAMGGPMTAPVDGRARPAWFHPGRSGTIALGPKATCPVRRTASQNPGGLRPESSGGGIRDHSRRHSRTQSQESQARAFAPSPFQAIERDFAFVVDAKVPAGEIVRAAKMADRALIESVSVFDVYEGKGVRRRQKIHRHRRAHAAQGQDPDRSRDRGAGGKDRRRRHQSDRRQL